MASWNGAVSVHGGGSHQFKKKLPAPDDQQVTNRSTCQGLSQPSSHRRPVESGAGILDHVDMPITLSMVVWDMRLEVCSGYVYSVPRRPMSRTLPSKFNQKAVNRTLFEATRAETCLQKEQNSSTHSILLCPLTHECCHLPMSKT